MTDQNTTPAPAGDVAQIVERLRNRGHVDVRRLLGSDRYDMIPRGLADEAAAALERLAGEHLAAERREARAVQQSQHYRIERDAALKERDEARLLYTQENSDFKTALGRAQVAEKSLDAERAARERAEAHNARLRDALQGLLDWVEIDSLPMDKDALHIARAALQPQPQGGGDA